MFCIPDKFTTRPPCRVPIEFLQVHLPAARYEIQRSEFVRSAPFRYCSDTRTELNMKFVRRVAIDLSKERRSPGLAHGSEKSLQSRRNGDEDCFAVLLRGTLLYRRPPWTMQSNDHCGFENAVEESTLDRFHRFDERKSPFYSGEYTHRGAGAAT